MRYFAVLRKAVVPQILQALKPNTTAMRVIGLEIRIERSDEEEDKQEQYLSYMFPVSDKNYTSIVIDLLQHLVNKNVIKTISFSYQYI